MNWLLNEHFVLDSAIILVMYKLLKSALMLARVKKEVCLHMRAQINMLVTVWVAFVIARRQ